MSARQITTALRGRWFGSYGAVRCPAHDDKRPSLRIRDGENGRLLVHCYAGCQAEDILAALRQQGLLDDAPAPRDNAQSRRIREAAERDRREKEARAIAIWKETQPVAGTPAEIYLRQRGITIQLPPTIRYHAALKHSATGLMLPAMVAAVQAPDRKSAASTEHL
jgi:hypothetical protein